MAYNTRTFTDLDFNFTANPVTGDVYVKTDEAAIKQALTNLILTSNYEVPFHPEYGCQVNQLLFSLYTPATDVIITNLIQNTIRSFEPRIQLLDIMVDGQNDENSITIVIKYKIINTTDPIVTKILLRRTR